MKGFPVKKASYIPIALSFLAGLSLLSTAAEAQAKKYTFKKGQLVNVTDGLCGVVNNKWTAVKKSGKSYILDTKKKSRCRSLLSPTALKKGGLSKIPSAASLMKTNSQTAGVAEPSGTPPILKDIPTTAGGIKGIFWTPGVVEAITAKAASPAQCSQFFVGQSDGTSAGVVGCYSLQGVGYAFQNILEGSGGTCYMKGVSNDALLNNGITISDGSLPDGKLANVFAAPSGNKDRLVKAVIGGFGGGGSPSQTGFIQVDSSSKLASGGLQYAYTSWFCDDGATTPSNKERVTVGIDGKFQYAGINEQNGMSFSNTITAYLATAEGSVGFDVTRERSSESYGQFGTSSFKGLVTISADNFITSKTYDNFGSGAHKHYAKSQFTGSSIADFRVPQSAVKDQFDAFNQAHQGAFEYRQDVARYVSSPANSLLSEVSSVDFSADTFYQAPDTVTPDFSGLSCTADAEVTLQMNFMSPALQQVGMACAQERLSNMNFCSSDATVNAAFMSFTQACSGGNQTP